MPRVSDGNNCTPGPLWNRPADQSYWSEPWPSCLPALCFECCSQQGYLSDGAAWMWQCAAGKDWVCSLKIKLQGQYLIACVMLKSLNQQNLEVLLVCCPRFGRVLSTSAITGRADPCKLEQEAQYRQSGGLCPLFTPPEGERRCWDSASPSHQLQEDNSTVGRLVVVLRRSE